MPLVPKRRIQPMPANDTEALFDGPGLPSEALFVDPLPAGGVFDADVEEARGDEDDHFYGAWYRGGGGRGGPTSRSQIMSAPDYTVQRTDQERRLGILPRKGGKYDDLEEAQAWLKAHGVNQFPTGPVRLFVPEGYSVGYGGRGLKDGDLVYDGMTIAYNPDDPVQDRIKAPFVGRAYKIGNGWEIVPSPAPILDELGPYLGLDRLTPEMRGRVIRQLEFLDQKYPGVIGTKQFDQLTVSAKDILGNPMGRAVATMGLGRMALHDRDFVTRGLGLDAQRAHNQLVNWTHGTTMETGILNHEFGHAVDTWLRDNEKSPFSRKAAEEHMDRLGAEIDAGGPLLPYNYKSPMETYWEFTDKRAWGTTEYSYTNHQERFAESFSRLQNVPDGTWDWYKEDVFHNRPKPLTPWEKELRTYLNTVPGWKT